ncbi:MarR family winged helix-turn-helix transcriptional regulator [uncultured Slackia sp.]|uniref:MarR family winged helix-turn-helix transcriptional regulator n=1 Tax=uncultured Slackia sp. TaxID=665903 RepID=UPI00267535AC|nr:MarR family winged helix-turn-helix transcriptional regulator [uncultured Slackia sp.]
MSESLEALRNEMFETMQRMRQRRSTPPLPPGITRGEINALMMLSMMEAHGDAVRPGMLAACSHATPGAVSQTLKSLEEKGLIVRRRGEGDSRSVTISLTDAGHEFEKEGRRLHDERFMHMLEFLGEDDAREFVRIVNRMLEFEESHPWKRASGGMCCGGERACAAESVPCPDSVHGQESAVCSDSTIGWESDFRFDSASSSTSETCCNSESSHASASRHPERFGAAGSGFRCEKEGGEPCA